MGISAELIPPPCPVETGGKGTVTDVVVLDPGNGYPQPPPGPRSQHRFIPSVTSNLIQSLYKFRYQLQLWFRYPEIEPNNGAVLTYECDTNGRIDKVNVVNPGSNFTTTPTIRMVAAPGTTPTGVNLRHVLTLRSSLTQLMYQRRDYFRSQTYQVSSKLVTSTVVHIMVQST